METLYISIIGILLVALLGGIGYYLRSLTHDIQKINAKLTHMENRLNNIDMKVVSMEPKLDAVWSKFLN